MECTSGADGVGTERSIDNCRWIGVEGFSVRNVDCAHDGGNDRLGAAVLVGGWAGVNGHAHGAGPVIETTVGLTCVTATSMGTPHMIGMSRHAQVNVKGGVGIEEANTQRKPQRLCKKTSEHTWLFSMVVRCWSAAAPSSMLRVSVWQPPSTTLQRHLPSLVLGLVGRPDDCDVINK